MKKTAFRQFEIKGTPEISLIMTKVTYQFFTIVNALQVLLCSNFLAIVSLQPRLYTTILIVKIVHVRHKILDNVHVRQRINLGTCIQVAVNLTDTRKSVGTTDIHGARSADTLAARSPECQSRIDLVFNFYQSIQHHWTASVKIFYFSYSINSVVFLSGIRSFSQLSKRTKFRK